MQPNKKISCYNCNWRAAARDAHTNNVYSMRPIHIGGRLAYYEHGKVVAIDYICPSCGHTIVRDGDTLEMDLRDSKYNIIQQIENIENSVNILNDILPEDESVVGSELNRITSALHDIRWRYIK